MQRLLAFLLFSFVFFITSCDPDSATDDDNPTVDFERQVMLENWVDNVVVPGYSDLLTSQRALVEAVPDVIDENAEEQLQAMRTAFRQAYLSYQRIAPLLIGDAERLQVRERLNTYPADIDKITANVIEGSSVNLALPSNFSAQGFPAMDYLLYGVDIGANDQATRNAYRNYLVNLTVQMFELTEAASAYWTDANRDDYIENDGNSATASIDRTVNDYIFYYEKFLRAGKVGIPAGVFSDDPLANRAEALYSGLSPELFAAALDATQAFFANHGLADYLDAMEVERDGEKLSTTIINQFASARAKASTINLPFDEQVETDNVQMLELYNELQRNVVLMKVDMLQALSINVDYVDADGD